ncbi:MAG: transcriptional repressor [Arcobacteraceae bacterium]|nr:transcriptional repressor [Arcobacteraceae bacterium]
MCKKIDNNIEDFLEFIELINKRLISHEQILTPNKEFILKILFDNSEHLSVNEIVNLSKTEDGKKLDTTTVYRILSNFETFNIIDSILLDDNKRRYELSYLKKPHYHLYCQYCSQIIEFESLDIHDKFLSQLNNINFQPTSFNVIINGVCKKCQTRGNKLV